MPGGLAQRTPFVLRSVAQIGGSLQFELEFQADSFRRNIGHRFLALLKRAVEARGLSYVAGHLDIAPSKLAHALNGTQRHPVRAEWVPIIAALAPNDDLADFLADLRGKDLVERKPLSPEEEVLAWREAVSDLPPDFRRLLEGRVRARRKGGSR